MTSPFYTLKSTNKATSKVFIDEELRKIQDSKIINKIVQGQ